MYRYERLQVSDACYEERTPKRQVVLSATGTLEGAEQWVEGCHEPRMLPTFVIERDGYVRGLYQSSYWSDYPQLGELNSGVISIALANCGPLKRGKDMRFHPLGVDANGMPTADMEQPAVRLFYEFCTQRPHRGFAHYELIYPAQLEALGNLLVRVINKHHIPYQYDPLTGGMTPNLKLGRPGVYLACGGNRMRTDLHPQIELINLLKKISK